MNIQGELAIQCCIVCSEVDFDKIILGKSLADASDFRYSSERCTRFCYELTSCKKCGHVSIQTDNPCWLPTRKYDFIKYGEPTEHYPFVAEILKSLEIDFNDASIHTFSYKDFLLANFLRAQLGIDDANLADWLGCSDDWLPTTRTGTSVTEPQPLRGFFSEIEKSAKTHKIVLITRFFDHVASQELLKKMISVASSTVHIVFDLNDYERLFALGTLEFIWNERRNLFHRLHLGHILARENQRFSMFAYESREVSPTLTGVISHLLPKCDENWKASTPSLNNSDLCTRLTSLRNRWSKHLTSNHKLGIIGASHKGISLAQFILDSGTIYSLHDDKEILRCKEAPVSSPLGFHSVSGFDFSDYTHIAITTTLKIAEKIVPKLRAGGYRGEILDFDCHKLD